MSYVYFSEEQKQRANEVDLEDFLMRNGEELLRSGKESVHVVKWGRGRDVSLK